MSDKSKKIKKDTTIQKAPQTTVEYDQYRVISPDSTKYYEPKNIVVKRVVIKN